MRQNVGDALGAYIIEALLGEGGMACVYQVRHAVLESAHAVKVLHPHLAQRDDVRQRFLSEGRIQARLRHPNILPVTDLINEPGVAGLVMEFLEGEDLETHLGRVGTLSLDDAISWTQQVLDALGFVHQHSVVHRDLKPSNLFLSHPRAGQTIVRVMDFGIAKIHEQNRNLTNPSMGKMGTLRYMSPEQLDRPDLVDQRTDVFAMGAILYEALVGRSPFDDDSDYHVMRRITEGQYTTPGSHVPPGVVAAISRALSTDPADRFESAAAFSDALEAERRADRHLRGRRLLRAVRAHGLPHDWWFEEDPSPVWLVHQEARWQRWLAEHGGEERTPEAESRLQQHWLDGGVSLAMLPVSGGQFSMGSPEHEPDRHDDEGPQRTVTVAPFSMMITPVTQQQWVSIAATNPSMFTADPRCPVEHVSWLDAIRFANQLSEHLHLRPAYFFEGDVVRWDRTSNGFRLPTEAEWEYACRAGGRAPPSKAIAARQAWFAENAGEQTHPVGGLMPNPWGFHDLQGNVYEWCWDRLGRYDTQAVDNPVGAELGAVRVLRGGSFRSPASDLRPAFRNGREEGFRHQSVGLRLVRGAPMAGD